MMNCKKCIPCDIECLRTKINEGFKRIRLNPYIPKEYDYKEWNRIMNEENSKDVYYVRKKNR